MSDEGRGGAADEAQGVKAPEPSVVALIDVLGFKSIERGAAGVATKALMSARQTIGGLTKWMSEKVWDHVHTPGGPPKVRVSWFSDTICLVAQAPEKTLVTPNGKDVRPALLDAAAMCVGYLLKRAATLEFPLTFRGVITVGEMLIEDENTYVGPAIAEASELYEQADGAFVWLSPAAATLRFPTKPVSHRELIEYDVRLKGGRTIKTKVVNPFIDMLPRGPQGIEVRSGIVRAMKSERLDVVIKRQNTVEFLDYVADTEPPPPQREHA